MRTCLDCYLFFLRQALEAARQAGATPGEQKEILDQMLTVLRKAEPTSSPPEIGDRVHRIVRESVGDGEPYREIKEEHTLKLLLDPSETWDVAVGAGDGANQAHPD